MSSDSIQLDLERGKVVRVGHTISHDFADIEQLDDGLWYYKPTTGGVLAGWVLREIADLLDEANREWNKELDKAMRQQPEKPLIDPFIIERQVGVVLRLKSVSSGNDHHCYIDPHASPSGVPFEVALMYLKAGRRVYHPQLEHDSYVVVAEGGTFNYVLPSLRTVKWLPQNPLLLLGDAWVVLPKEEKP